MQRAFEARCIVNTLFLFTECKHNPMPLAHILPVYIGYFLTKTILMLHRNSMASSRTKAQEVLLSCKLSGQKENLQETMQLALLFLIYITTTYFAVCTSEHRWIQVSGQRRWYRKICTYAWTLVADVRQEGGIAPNHVQFTIQHGYVN